MLRIRSWLRLLPMTVAAALAVAPAASAQAPLDGSAYAFAVPDYVGAIVGANSLDPHSGGTGAKPKEHEAKVKRPTARQLATLGFRRTPQVTQSVYQRVIDEAGPGIDPAVLTGQLDFAKAQFRKVLGRVGWRSTDLGDVAAFSLVQGYVTWHQVRNASGQGMKALRREVRDNLALQKQVRRLSDARQQEIAEIMELRVILLLDAYADATASGDPANVAIARAKVREWIESIFDVDVNDVRLTRDGLVHR